MKNLVLAVAALAVLDPLDSSLAILEAPQTYANPYPWGDGWAWEPCRHGAMFCPASDRPEPYRTPPATVKLYHEIPCNADNCGKEPR
jgi:hypothetical protein